MATAEKPIPLVLVLAGLTERRQQLIEKQPSLDRVFDLIEIKRFSPEETREFYQRMFDKANVEITEAAVKLLAHFSGGFPVFMHELGDAVFKIDRDNRVDEHDTLDGILLGAQVIGAKYVEPNVLATIRSQNYQHILKKVAHKPFEPRFTRKEVVSRLTAAEAKVFDNFLRKMEKLGAIKKDKERGAGGYAFASELFYLFFWLASGHTR